MKALIGAASFTTGFLVACGLVGSGLTALYREGGYVAFVDDRAVVVTGRRHRREYKR